GAIDLAERIVANLHLTLFNAVGLHLSADQEALCDLQLLGIGVTGQTDDFHPVTQWPRNSVEHIGGGDKHYPTQIIWHTKIVIPERIVLLGIEHFKQRRGRIPMDASTELIDLIQHHHAIARTCFSNTLDNVARKSADVRASVTTNFRLVMYSPETHPDKFAIHCSRNRLT